MLLNYLFFILIFGVLGLIVTPAAPTRLKSIRRTMRSFSLFAIESCAIYHTVDRYLHQ